jgi:hypothetical protein
VSVSMCDPQNKCTVSSSLERGLTDACLQLFQQLPCAYSTLLPDDHSLVVGDQQKPKQRPSLTSPASIDSIRSTAIRTQAVAEVACRLAATGRCLPEARRALAAEGGCAVVGDAILTHPPEGPDVIEAGVVELALDGVPPAATIVVLGGAHVGQGAGAAAGRHIQRHHVTAVRGRWWIKSIWDMLTSNGQLCRN